MTIKPICLLFIIYVSPSGVRGDRSDQATPVGLQQLQLHSGQSLQGLVCRRGETQRGREVGHLAAHQMSPHLILYYIIWLLQDVT